jgi:hypothetical protein
VPRIEFLYVTLGVSRSVCFSTQLRSVCSGKGCYVRADNPDRDVCDTRTPPYLEGEADHFLRSPRCPACITTVHRITDPTSPAMRAGVAEAGRQDCRHGKRGRGLSFVQVIGIACAERRNVPGSRECSRLIGRLESSGGRSIAAASALPRTRLRGKQLVLSPLNCKCFSIP